MFRIYAWVRVHQFFSIVFLHKKKYNISHQCSCVRKRTESISQTAEETQDARRNHGKTNFTLRVKLQALRLTLQSSWCWYDGSDDDKDHDDKVPGPWRQQGLLLLPSVNLGTRSFNLGLQKRKLNCYIYTRVGTLMVATTRIYLQLIQNRYMFRSSTVLQCSHQHCVQPVASDVEVVGHL